MQTTDQPAPAQATQAFIHRPRPAIVPDEAKHAWQRRFGIASEVTGYKLDPLTDREMFPSIRVMRDANGDTAELELSIGCWTSASLSMRLTPDELREIAARLIDAAHDIETFPAAYLKGGAA